MNKGNNDKIKRKESSESSDFNPALLKNWQSQDEFVMSLEQQLENVDPIRYKQVKYHKHEWDNIPPVVPKFIINLSKYVEGLSNLAYKTSQEESVAQLRNWSEAQLNVRNMFLHTVFRILTLELLIQTDLGQTNITSC